MGTCRSVKFAKRLPAGPPQLPAANEGGAEVSGGKERGRSKSGPESYSHGPIWTCASRGSGKHYQHVGGESRSPPHGSGRNPAYVHV